VDTYAGSLAGRRIHRLVDMVLDLENVAGVLAPLLLGGTGILRHFQVTWSWHSLILL
jgi:hypothetical protein